MFAIGVTGSIQGDIDGVKANVAQMIAHLYQNAKEQNLDTRVGILTYTDNDLSWVIKSAQTPAEAISAINRVNEKGGGTELVAAG